MQKYFIAAIKYQYLGYIFNLTSFYDKSRKRGQQKTGQ